MTKKTKRKLPSDQYDTVEGKPSERIELGNSNKIHVERLKHRVSLKYFIRYFLFNIELNVPFPQLYILGIQIIWEWDDYQLPLLQRRIAKIHHIGFVPD